MKPYVICHMVASVDGRTLISRWWPRDAHQGGLFDRLHDRLGGDAWLVGRVTGQEYARLAAYPDHSDHSYPREPWVARRDAAAHGIVLDAHGKIAWGRADIGDDPIVAVLTEKVSDAHLAGLRKDGVSYIFAGESELDLGLALEILNQELGINRLLLEGGDNANGSFFARASSTRSALRFSAVDGAKGAPCVFDSGDEEAGAPAPLRAMRLESSEVLERGVVWLRYRLQNG